MAKILIRRKAPETMVKELFQLLTQLRAITVKQPGYVNGETLRRIDQQGETLVISTWQSIADWNKWFEKTERTEIQDKIDELLGEKTTYEIYDY